MMASGGEGESNLKRHATEFPNKYIDLKRFAYETIKYSVLKFNVPETCISVWEGPENDYGCSNFCLETFRPIVHYQFLFRYDFHACFSERYESNNLESFELIASLLIDVINEYYKDSELDIIDKVEVSLSIACELVLFLHSENLNLYVKQLAGHWFDGFFLIVKESFEKAGGLDQMHLRVCRPEFWVKDLFDDVFISECCLPYKDSVKNRNLGVHYVKLVKDSYKKIQEYFRQKECEKKEDIFIHESLREDGTTKTQKRSEASGIDSSQSTRHETPQNEELFRARCALAAEAILSTNLPGTSFQETPKQNQVFSVPEINEISKSNLRPCPEHGPQFSLDSSKVKQSSDERGTVSIAKDTKPSHNHPVARPKEQPSCVSSGWQTSESNLYSSVEQGLEHSSLSSSKAKQSGEKKATVSVAEDAAPSDDLLDARRKIPAEYTQGSLGFPTLPSGRSIVHQRIRELNLYSLWNTVLNEKKSNGSVVEDAPPSDDLGARPKEQASTGSAALQTSESNLDSSVEQGVGQLSLDSSSKK